MCHIFCIHSSVHGYLGCFQILAIVNSAATNIGEQLSLQSTDCRYLRNMLGLLDHVIFNFEFFEESPICKLVVALICIPTSSVQGPPFLHILASICYSLSLGISHFNWDEIILL